MSSNILPQRRERCPYCSCFFSIQGIGNHKQACKQKSDQQLSDSQFHNDLDQQTRATANSFTPINIIGSATLDYHSTELEYVNETSPESSSVDDQVTPEDNDTSNAACLILNSIDHVNLIDEKIVKEYHPSAILDPQILPLRDFLADSTSKQSSLFDSHPWHPFSSQLDFDLAEFILHTGMNHQACSDFFSIIDQCGGSQSTEYTIRNENDLAEAWSRAENLFTKFKKETISVPYKNEVRNYDVHYRPLWDWTLDLLRDKDLAPYFVWDAVHLFREDKNGIRTWFFNEPWSGNIFWEVQSSLPPNGKPLAYILYADKSCLSSFGTAKGYPNFGGGCVVGWLPIVEEEEDHKGKPSWINFKRVVWHEAFWKILGSLAQYSHSGYAFQPPNSDKVIILYPFILILSADYEEQLLYDDIDQRWQSKLSLSSLLDTIDKSIRSFNNISITDN
ncbi:uncharacterized protein EV420DRAFT_1678556 [Desarmillaria tabescens]|uniref:Uncharacterized protein n=1 Tax=Armillaria tabescens TaxID=1929756 RepID=A0AA39J372_ARMTA|nr:uncharacterized protein EV420DRAFT_1678556 [Desarmillaria tabescens]KAK0435233.1 hypothetical protein EV420DRAFT_1678556 [Desarmillaria tabescens]